MKKSVSLFIMLLVFSFSNAQKINFGIKAGLNVSMLTGTEGIMTSTNGIHMGTLVEFKVSDRIRIQPEVLFSSQGAKSVNTTNPVYGTEIKINNNIKLDYLIVPIIAKYYVANDFFLEVGPQVGFLITAKNSGDVNTTVAGTSSLESFNDNVKETVKSRDYAANVGFGYDFLTKAFVEARYSIGLSNISTVSNTDVKNGVFQLSVGYKF